MWLSNAQVATLLFALTAASFGLLAGRCRSTSWCAISATDRARQLCLEENSPAPVSARPSSTSIRGDSAGTSFVDPPPPPGAVTVGVAVGVLVDMLVGVLVDVFVGVDVGVTVGVFVEV